LQNRRNFNSTPLKDMDLSASARRAKYRRSRT